MSAFKPMWLAGLALLASGAANAANTIDIKFGGVDPSTLVLSTSGTTNYATGALPYLTQDGSFIAYCVELAQSHSLKKDGFQTFSVGSFDAATTDSLQRLYSSTYATVDTPTEQAAFQTAIWELTHETSASKSVSFGSGSFYFSSIKGADGATNSAFNGLVDGYLSTAASYAGPNLYSVSKLSSANYQDLVAVTSVPEPSSYALMGAGLAAIGFLSRRRKQQR